MKQILSISLALWILISNIGLTFNQHWCAGVIVEHSVSLGSDALSCGMPEAKVSCETMKDSPQVKQLSCCDTSHEVLQVEDTTSSESSFLIQNPMLIAVFVHQFIIPLFFELPTLNTVFNDYAPPFLAKDVHLLFEVFLI